MKHSSKNQSLIYRSEFGTTKNGEPVSVFTLSNANGISISVINYGGAVISLKTPDHEGEFENIVLGYETLADYESGVSYMGALIGRFANRIANGVFELNGETYSLATNAGHTHLHGGELGFDKVVWDAEASIRSDGPSLLLKYTSADGEEGYPGTLRVRVRYTLTSDNKLQIDYEASTNRVTPINLTSHCYFNLSGDMKRDILDHHLEISADLFTPVDQALIPTGEYCPVEGTPFDFRTAKSIGKEINADNQQIRLAHGFDHNWVIDMQADGEMKYVATLSNFESGRVLKVHSTEPGLQFYSGNALSTMGTSNRMCYKNRDGLCLETQHFPDSPNQPKFPSTTLRPGEVYRSRTIYAFSTIPK